MPTSHAPVFVATLGGQPQIFTFALDLLYQQGIPIRQAYALHVLPEDPTDRYMRTIQTLRREFVGDVYQGQPCTFQAIPLQRRQREPLRDFDSTAAVNDAWSTIHQFIGGLKTKGHEVHMCVSGGRRIMSFLALSIAALHFATSDRLWHLFTPEPLLSASRDGQRLHVGATAAVQPQLIEVPIMPGSEYFPALRQFLSTSPEEVIAARRQLLEESDRQRCQQVWEQLTSRQRQVLVLLARGLTPQEAAAQLKVAPTTVNTHQHTIYGICRTVWALPDQTSLDYRWIEQRFGRWRNLPSM